VNVIFWNASSTRRFGDEVRGQERLCPQLLIPKGKTSASKENRAFRACAPNEQCARTPGAQARARNQRCVRTIAMAPTKASFYGRGHAHIAEARWRRGVPMSRSEIRRPRAQFTVASTK
jgi:hypothetical protein